MDQPPNQPQQAGFLSLVEALTLELVRSGSGPDADEELEDACGMLLEV
jgi:hypothetical protein